jgi:hypothetical protein
VSETVQWIVQEISGLLAILGALIATFGGAQVIGSLTNWLNHAPATPRHVRGAGQLRPVYKTNWAGHGKVYVLSNDVKVIEGRKN